MMNKKQINNIKFSAFSSVEGFRSPNYMLSLIHICNNLYKRTRENPSNASIELGNFKRLLSKLYNEARSFHSYICSNYSHMNKVQNVAKIDKEDFYTSLYAYIPDLKNAYLSHIGMYIVYCTVIYAVLFDDKQKTSEEYYRYFLVQCKRLSYAKMLFSSSLMYWINSASETMKIDLTKHYIEFEV